jgi:protein-tyrosine phosphatase
MTRPDIFAIPIDAAGTLAIATRPRGGDWLADDLESLALAGVDTLVSLLEIAELVELGLENQPALCALHGLHYSNVPVPDLGLPPDTDRFLDAVRDIVSALRTGQNIAVHCRQSIGRSGLFAVSVVVALGATLERAREEVSTSCGVPMPETPAQLDWLQENVGRLSVLASDV